MYISVTLSVYPAVYYIEQMPCIVVRECCGVNMYITKYGRTLYIGMDEVLAHYASTFENLDLHFHFQ